MAISVMIPKEGSVENCTITKWNYKVGDKVNTGDIICEVETNKSAFDLESPGDGTILEILYGENTEVPVLTTIAIIGQPGEDYSELLPVNRKQPEKQKVENSNSEIAGETAYISKYEKEKGCFGGKVLASPRARRLSSEKGVPLFAIKGSGPEGSIVEKDVLRWIAENRPVTSTQGVEENGLYDICPHPETMDRHIEIPVKGLRKVTAERMLSSLLTTAQYTLTTAVDAERLLEYRCKLKNSPDNLGMKEVTIGDMLLYTVSKTLANFRELNCHYINNRILQFDNINLAFAVDTPRGLVVPVIKKAEKLSLKEISMKAKRLRDLCMNGKIPIEDITGGTFTLSNMGPLGIDAFTPVLNPPQVAILGVGRISLRPVSIDGQVCFKNCIQLSLTLDHQVVDGARGAGFLKLLSDYLSNIDMLAVK